MCDVGKELDNAANSVSNALGTDGSKNGLLNDPVSMAALAIGTGIYFAAPAAGAAAVADAGVTAGTISAAPAVAAVDLGLNFTPTLGSIASDVAGAVPWSAIGNGALQVGKAVLPALLTSGGSRQAYPVQAGYQPNGTYVSISPNGTATAYRQPADSYNVQGASGGGSGLLILAALALLVLKA